MWATMAEGQPSPHEEILINVEAFRGAVRKGDWKLIKIALLPGKTQLYNLAKDPGEKNDVAARIPRSSRELKARLLAYASEHEAELVDQGAARLRRQSGQDGLRPRFRHRRQRAAA